MRRGKCQETASCPSIDVYFRIMPENTPLATRPDASKEQLLREEIKSSRETRTNARGGGRGGELIRFGNRGRFSKQKGIRFPKIILPE